MTTYPNGKWDYDECSYSNDPNHCCGKSPEACDGAGDHTCEKYDSCPKCKAPACKSCLVTCELCGVTACGRCCQEHGNGGLYLIDKVLEIYRCHRCPPPVACAGCAQFVPEKHKQNYCRSNDRCRESFCHNCMYTCRLCYRDYCANHMANLHRC